MTTFPEYSQYDGLGLAQLVTSKQVAPGELVEEAIARTERHNPQINAIIYKLYDQARAAASGPLPDGPFKGVPFLLKDLHSQITGIPISFGTRILRDVPSPFDAEMTIRYRRAGLIPVGRTSAPEFGILPYTEPEAFGPTHNPWNLDLTPGGSSGGSAAAVAARIVPLADASDGGGSIRTPASCCGLFGLKPTRARTPTGPYEGELWRGFAIQHAITRSVRDSAALLDCVAGPDAGTLYYAPPVKRTFLSEVTHEPGRLRIAFTAKPWLGHEVHPDCLAGLEDTVRLLEGLGHELFEADLVFDRKKLSMAFLLSIAAETAVGMRSAEAAAGRKFNLDDFEPTTSALYLLASATSAANYAQALHDLQFLARQVAPFFEKYDVLLTPSLAAPPFPIRSLQPKSFEKTTIRLLSKINGGRLMLASGIVDKNADHTFDWIPYAPIWNVTGQPAMSVPLYWNAEGVPIGMHFVGRFGDEATLFRLAGQLERAQPWCERTPEGY
jgi:amidase